MFAKAAEDEAQQRRQDIQDLIDKRIQDALKAVKQEALENAEKKMELELYRIKQAQKRELAGYRNIAKKKVLLRRVEFIEKLSRMVEAALVEYVSGDEYKEWLSENIHRELREKPNATAVLRPVDYEHLELMGTTASSKVGIGGYRLVCTGFAVDCTFGARLTELMEEFCGFE